MQQAALQLPSFRASEHERLSRCLDSPAGADLEADFDASIQKSSDACRVVSEREEEEEAVRASARIYVSHGF